MELGSRAADAVTNLLIATVAVWSRTLPADVFDYRSRSVVLSWFIGFLVAGIALFTIRRLAAFAGELSSGTAPLSNSNANAGDRNAMLLFGAATSAVAGLPFVVSGRRIELDLPFFDRIALAYVVGASLLLGVLLCGSRRRSMSIALVTAVTFLGTTYHVRNNNTYRKEWSDQASLFRQMTARLPSLRAGSAVLLCNTPGSLVANHSAGVLDLIYGVSADDRPFLRWILDLDSPLQTRRSDAETYRTYAESLRPDAPIVNGVRTFWFNGTTSQVVVAWRSPSGTLRVVDKDRPEELTDLPAQCRAAAHLSDPAAVQDLVAVPARGPLWPLLQSEDDGTWPMAYQEADLARQRGDMKGVERVRARVVAHGLNPRDPSEWIPFIEGAAMAGEEHWAAEKTVELLRDRPVELVALSVPLDSTAQVRILGVARVCRGGEKVRKGPAVDVAHQRRTGARS